MSHVRPPRRIGHEYVSDGRGRRTQVGRWLLAGSTVLLILQFTWGFSTSRSLSNPGLPILILYMTPCILFLTSLYLLFSPGPAVASRSLPVRLLLYLVAAYAAAGGLFMLVLVGTLAVGGPDFVVRLFDHLGWILGIATIVLLPLMVKTLR